MKKGYWLIAYVERNDGQQHWTPANLPWHGTPGSALQYLTELNVEYSCQHVVLSAMPISKAEYEWAKDNV